jgi:hypothetical protein
LSISFCASSAALYFPRNINDIEIYQEEEEEEAMASYGNILLSLSLSLAISKEDGR